MNYIIYEKQINEKKWHVRKKKKKKKKKEISDRLHTDIRINTYYNIGIIKSN